MENHNAETYAAGGQALLNTTCCTLHGCGDKLGTAYMYGFETTLQVRPRTTTRWWVSQDAHNDLRFIVFDVNQSWSDWPRSIRRSAVLVWHYETTRRYDAQPGRATRAEESRQVRLDYSYLRFIFFTDSEIWCHDCVAKPRARPVPGTISTSPKLYAPVRTCGCFLNTVFFTNQPPTQIILACSSQNCRFCVLKRPHCRLGGHRLQYPRCSTTQTKMKQRVHQIRQRGRHETNFHAHSSQHVLLPFHFHWQAHTAVAV